MRCIDCDEKGHYKCLTEEESKLMTLTFIVEDNLDEFIAGNDSIIKLTKAAAKQIIKQERKRDKKKKAKKL